MQNKIIRMNQIIVIMITSIFFLGMFLNIQNAYAASEDVEYEQIRTNLERTTMIWQIKKSMGVFAQSDIHPKDMYKYFVYSADAVNRKYVVNYTFAPWTTEKFQSTYIFQDSDYKLIKRDWYSAKKDIYCVQDAAYWYSVSALRSMFTIDYSDEMIGGRLINLVTISIYINETNYDIARYTRSEGILLSRHTKVDSIKSGVVLKGEFLIELKSYSGTFTVSFWHYVIWFVIIFGIVLASMVILSLFISRRQEKIRSLDY